MSKSITGAIILTTPVLNVDYFIDEIAPIFITGPNIGDVKKEYTLNINMPIYLDDKHEEVFKFWVESFDPNAHNVIVAKASNGGNTYIFSLTREDLGDRFFEKFCK